MKKMMVFLVAMITALIFNGAAHCQMMGHGMGGMMQGMGPAMMGSEPSTEHWSLPGVLHQWGRHLFSQKDRLGLTDEQVRKMQSIIMDHVKYSFRKVAEKKVLGLEIQELLLKEEITLQEIEKRLKSIEGLDSEMNMEGISTFEKVLSVLSPEQRKDSKGLLAELTFARFMGNGSGRVGMGVMTGHGE